MYSSIDIAKYILARADSVGELISNKRLQKLMYYVQAWYLVEMEGISDPLFDEVPQAWVHGPVYPKVYEYFKDFSFGPISLKDEYTLELTELVQQDRINGSDLADRYVLALEKKISLSDEVKSLIIIVMDHYSRLSAFELEMMTNREHPWKEQRIGLSEFEHCTYEISLESMYNFYHNLYTSSVLETA